MAPSTTRKTSWASYMVGRHPWAIWSWQSIVFAISRCYARPWKIEIPLDQFCGECDDAHTESFEQLDIALRELARSNAVNPAILIELHRVIDSSAQIAGELAGLIVEDSLIPRCDRDPEADFDTNVRERIYDKCVEGISECILVNELSEEVLSSREDVETWRSLGAAIGRTIRDVAATGVETEHLSVGLKHTRGFAQRLAAGHDAPPLAKLIDHATKFVDTKWEKEKASGEYLDVAWEAIEHLIEADDDIQTFLLGQVSSYLIVIDESAEELIYLGHRFSFDQFNQCKSALACFFVLAKSPGKSMSGEEIVKAADIGVEPERLTQYFSRLRNVLKPAYEEYIKWVPKGRRAGAKLAFIKPVECKSDAGGKTPGFKLDLDRERVKQV